MIVLGEYLAQCLVTKQIELGNFIWSVSLRINDPRDLRLKPVNKEVGIDLGISSLLTQVMEKRFLIPHILTSYTRN